MDQRWRSAHVGPAARAVLASLVWLVGCPGPACPVYPHTDPARALRMHRSLRRTVDALRAEARVDQRGPQGRVRGTVLMYLQRPDRVRFDAMTQFGPAATLTSDGSSFQLMSTRDNRFQQGPSCPANIARLLGVAVGGDELVHFLMGDTPRLSRDATMQCGDEGYVIALTGEGGRRQEIVLRAREADLGADPTTQHLRLMRSEMFHPDGRTDWRATYDDYEVVRDPADAEGRGVAFPFRIRFEDPDLGADTLIRVKSVEIVDAVPPDAFRQVPPAGIAVEHVACE